MKISITMIEEDQELLEYFRLPIDKNGQRLPYQTEERLLKLMDLIKNKVYKNFYEEEPSFKLFFDFI